MLIRKVISEDREFYLYLNGKLIYKKWLDTGHSKVFDLMAYDKYSYASYTDLDLEESFQLITVKANLRLYTTKEGGRQNGIISGYRPNHVFEYNEMGEMREAYMGEIISTKEEWLQLGKDHQVII